MTRDEQKSITEFVERAVCGAQPEIDVEADAIIRALFVRNPDAAYRVTMLAMAQEREARVLRDQVDAAARRRGWLGHLFDRRSLPHVRREPVLAQKYPA